MGWCGVRMLVCTGHSGKQQRFGVQRLSNSRNRRVGLSGSLLVGGHRLHRVLRSKAHVWNHNWGGVESGVQEGTRVGLSSRSLQWRTPLLGLASKYCQPAERGRGWCVKGVWWRRKQWRGVVCHSSSASTFPWPLNSVAGSGVHGSLRVGAFLFMHHLSRPKSLECLPVLSLSSLRPLRRPGCEPAAQNMDRSRPKTWALSQSNRMSTRLRKETCLVM